MSRVVLIGSQWGDEGKGKVTDFLGQQADVVVRSQGGNNAGHTIIIGEEKFALQTIPSGIFNPKIKNVLANGMVINPKRALEELKNLEKRGITDYQLFISNRAHVIMPYHLDMDGAYEKFKGDNKIGTTKKGIGPCYSDKSNRIGIRMGDLVDPISLRDALENALPIKNMELESLGLKPYNFRELYEEYVEIGKKFAPFVCDTSELLQEEIEKNSNILFEGAQGTMLCLDHGTYPYVTSSSPTAASVPVNAGVPPQAIDHVVGICKAYTTRVGEGPFATELKNHLGDLIRERGHEYGTVTKRPRRVGYLDLVVVNYAKRISGIDSLALMLLDVLTGIDELKICVGYKLDGKRINTIPATLRDYSRCEPIYIDLPSWKEDITNVTNYDELPANAKNYVETIEKVTGIPVDIISIGAERNSTIIRRNIFKI